jgi:hypothetical protein
MKALQELGSELVGFGFLTSTLVVLGATPQEATKTAHRRAHHCLARVCDHRGDSQRSGGLALQPCGPRLRQCPPPDGLDPQPRAHRAAVDRVGGRRPQPASQRTRRWPLRGPTDQRRSGWIFMSAMSATPWLSARPAPASRCCSPSLPCSGVALPAPKSSCSTRADRRARPSSAWAGRDRPRRQWRCRLPAAGPHRHSARPRRRAQLGDDASRSGGSADTPEVKEPVWSALGSLMSAPPEQRHLTGLRLLVQNAAVQAALLPYTQEGAMGGVFDGAEDRLTLSDLVLFEMEEIMARPRRRRLPCSTCSTGWKSSSMAAPACSFSMRPGCSSIRRSSPPASANG